MTRGVIEKRTLGRVCPLNPFKIIMSVVNWLDPAAAGRGTMGFVSGAGRSPDPAGQRLMNDYFSLCNLAGSVSHCRALVPGEHLENRRTSTARRRGTH